MNSYLFIFRSKDGASIFNTRTDYEKSVEMIDYLIKDCQIDIRSYCLMPDRIKLIVTLDLSEVKMTISINDHKYGLFLLNTLLYRLPQNFQMWRQCVSIDQHANLLELCEYLESEPVRFGIVEHAKEYPYSSAFHNKDHNKINDQGFVSLSEKKCKQGILAMLFSKTYSNIEFK